MRNLDRNGLRVMTARSYPSKSSTETQAVNINPVVGMKAESKQDIANLVQALKPFEHQPVVIEVNRVPGKTEQYVLKKFSHASKPNGSTNSDNLVLYANGSGDQKVTTVELRQGTTLSVRIATENDLSDNVATQSESNSNRRVMAASLTQLELPLTITIDSKFNPQDWNGLKALLKDNGRMVVNIQTRGSQNPMLFKFVDNVQILDKYILIEGSDVNFSPLTACIGAEHGSVSIYPPPQ